MTRITITWLLIANLGLTPWSFAAPADEKEAALAKVRQSIETLRKEIAATQHQHDAVSAELADIEQRIAQVHKLIRRLQQDQRQQQKKLTKLGAQERQLQTEVNTQSALLARQMRAAYMIGNQEQLKLWLNAQDPAAVSRTGVYYDYLHRARARRIHDLRQSVTQLLALRDSLKVERERLSALQQQQQTIQQELQVRSASRAAVLQKLQAELTSKEQQLAQSLQDEKRLNQLVNALREVIPEALLQTGQRSPFGRLKGKLHWPTLGRVQDSFGKKQQSGRTRINGVRILAPAGHEVHAVAPGRVAYADWLRGYGMLLILDHGDGYMSLYGHNQAIYKELGEWVQAGELIASVGSSGGETQDSLYFELRHNGTPINPMVWCRR
ncbi:MAG: peptidoglycan DD-metalloendopeptidase family protein [Gammaproteobacteria bacterium]|nr:peptidoglycan DD-metalloendopeptidase family protein [Gammaproteobacteria bacterium]